MIERTVRLQFVNRTAEETHTLHVAKASAALIMDWYGGYYAGDDYDALINGVKQNLGINGELEPVTIDVYAT